jgi:hypothetical protein
MTSSSAEKLEARPLTNEQGTLKYPVDSVETAVIAKNAKSFASSLFEILKWPLMRLVESSMVLR